MAADVPGQDRSVFLGSDRYSLDAQKRSEYIVDDAQKRSDPIVDDVQKRTGTELLDKQKGTGVECQGRKNNPSGKSDICGKCAENGSGMFDFLNPGDEMLAEKDFRMLQGMYPAAAKELLPLIEEECDRMEYEGSAMFDEYPDYTTVYTIQKRIEEAARDAVSSQGMARGSGMDGSARGMAWGAGMDGFARGMAREADAETAARGIAWGADAETAVRGETYESEQTGDLVSRGDLIRVMLLQEMHRRRCRYRACAEGGMI